MTFESGFHEGELSKDKDRNRHFLLKRTDLNQVLWLLSLFLVLFVYSIIFVVFVLKPDMIDASICVFWVFFSPQGIYFCMCSFVFIESLSARINMI